MRELTVQMDHRCCNGQLTLDDGNKGHGSGGGEGNVYKGFHLHAKRMELTTLLLSSIRASRSAWSEDYFIATDKANSAADRIDRPNERLPRQSY